MFFELGCDVGILTMSDKVESYYSIYPYAHVAFFLPFPTRKGGFYVGAGAGYMMSYYKFADGDIQNNIFAINATAGFNLFDFLDISYTIRVKPDFESASNKLSIGYVYRF